MSSNANALQTFGTLTSFIQDTKCTPPAGQTRSVSGKAPWDYYYELRRLPLTLDNPSVIYEITLPITITALPGHEPKEADFANQMQKRAQSCYDSAKPYMLGPNGEHLSIRLKRMPADYNGPAFGLQVYEGDLWTRFNAWNLHYPCSTIFHETMHALGLPDEYPEESRGFFRDKEEQFVRWATAADQQDPKLKDKIQYTGECPRAKSIPDSIMYDQEKAFAMFGLENATDTSTSPTRKSIYFPNQFRSLVSASDCDANVKTYRTCTENSGRQKEDKCLNFLPRACAGDSTEWLGH